MENVFINTLVYAEAYKPPMNQKILIDELIKNGFYNIEVRREFMANPKEEIREIGKDVWDNKVNLFYSINDTLFKNKKVDRKKVGKYIDEADYIGAKVIKLSLGDFEFLSESDAQFLREVRESKIRLFIENDQTKESGKVENILKFIEGAKLKNVKPRIVFDIGNFLFVGEDSKENAVLLKDYVEYVHFKDGEFVDGIWQWRLLGEGTSDYQYFKEFFKGKVFGLENPCGLHTIDTIKKEIGKLI